jgi:phenylacetate-CoA ligase
MSDYYDALETRSPEQREHDLFSRLPGLLQHAKKFSPYFASRLGETDASRITDRAALSTLPVTRKSALFELQQTTPPFGGMVAQPPGRFARLFVSPGPIYDPEGTEPDFWRAARVLHAAGFRSGDIVHNAFSYHLTPAGSMFETGAHAMGCAVIPAGTGQSELQVATIAALRPDGYVGTPSFLKILVEKAIESNIDIGSLKRAVVSGEAFLPPVRDFLRDKGIDAYQAYGTADLGMIAYESSAREGMILDEQLIVEIVRPGTGDPVPDGEVGEVVVTTFTRAYPLIRFATGNLSAILPGQSPCGRTNRRIKGWMGRADQTTKVRGMFVHPHQVADVIKRHPEIARARLVVSHADGVDAMELICEVSNVADGLAGKVAESIRDVTKLRGDVRIVTRGALVNDGKVIEDRRTYN